MIIMAAGREADTGAAAGSYILICRSQWGGMVWGGRQELGLAHSQRYTSSNKDITPNSSTNWQLSIQLYKPLGANLIQTTTPSETSLECYHRHVHRCSQSSHVNTEHEPSQLSMKKRHKPGMVAYICNSNMGRAEAGG